MPAPGVRPPFCLEEAGHLSRSASPGTGRRYGLQRVCRIFGLARSTAYYLKTRHTRTLKGQPLWGRCFVTVAALAEASREFKREYNERWLIGRHGDRTPGQVRRDRLGGVAAA